ncbi:serine/threonine-protein kinase [Trichocoleus sp. DQ-A3]|uniref:serine/threonine-protein kinase n=1 Tax=Cyanophyceae TaxID=3028117 RepID=UPI00168A0BED|nr:serine/threonine-protein kinase [Coleofasciculus sp. FACHB-125]MBD1902069.1 serine/threonine protein kinase [Coleofasciculus sp. FACHB-125]
MIAAATIRPGILLQGRYRVVRQIGGGGFGQIFEVDDGGEAKVLKVLSLERFNNPIIKNKAIVLFQREAEFLSRIRHPGIPRVEPDGYFTWSGASSEPLHCLVMEKIAGCNLQEWLLARSNQPITTEEARTWLTQLLEILQQLHQQQYFHRDIKLSNIMLRPQGQLVLVDFGAVREVTQSYLQQQKGNETGTVIISAGYTPPEQAEGRAVPQSDFFALGRTFVYLLTGKPPLDFPKNPQTGELIWRDQAPQVSPQLAGLIERMMAPFPGQRPQNSEKILQYLAEIEQNSHFRWRNLIQSLPGIRSLDEQPTSLNDKVSLRYNPWFQLTLAGLLLLGGINLWKSSPDIAFTLNSQGAANYKTGRLKTAEFYYRLALIFNQKMAEPQYNLGVLYEDQQKPKQARAAYEIAVQEDFDRAYNNLARLYILDKQHTKAVPLLQKGLLLAYDDKAKYAILKNLGWAQLELGRYQEAQTYLQKAIDVFSDKAAAYCLKAQVLERQGNQQASLPAWGNCLKYGKENNLDEKRWMSLAPPALRIQRTQR